MLNIYIYTHIYIYVYIYIYIYIYRIVYGVQTNLALGTVCKGINAVHV